MIRRPFRGFRLAAFFLLAVVAGRAAPWWDNLHVRDLQGNPVALQGKYVALVFVSVDCPLSNSSLPTLEALAKKYPQVTFLAAYEDCDATVEALRAHRSDYGFSFSGLDDRDQHLSRFCQAVYTPEVAVYSLSGALEYRGRIDNKQDDFGSSRPSATQHDLADVLEALAAGKTGPFAFHPGFGCALPRKVSP